MAATIRPAATTPAMATAAKSKGNGGVRMDMLTLTRGKYTDQGTPGALAGPGLALFTLELPWRDNRAQRSCIPCGQFVCKPVSSTRFGAVYLLQGVFGRSAILIHAGNFAGDVERGFLTNSRGCILVGCARGTANGQLAVLDSQAGMRLLRGAVGLHDCILTITGECSCC